MKLTTTVNLPKMTPDEEIAFCRWIEAAVREELIKALADAQTRALIHGGSILDPKV